MAKVDVSVSSKLSPAEAWAFASDLKRFDEWLTIFGGWKGEVPDRVEKGTTVSSLIKVKGFRNTITWEVTDYDPPRSLAMEGCGRGGIRIALDLAITDDDPGSTFHLRAQLSGGLLSGPVGGLVARLLRSDVEKSVKNLAALKVRPGS